MVDWKGFRCGLSNSFSEVNHNNSSSLVSLPTATPWLLRFPAVGIKWPPIWGDIRVKNRLELEFSVGEVSVLWLTAWGGLFCVLGNPAYAILLHEKAQTLEYEGKICHCMALLKASIRFKFRVYFSVPQRFVGCFFFFLINFIYFFQLKKLLSAVVANGGKG